jgi:hypothetical protein
MRRLVDAYDEAEKRRMERLEKAREESHSSTKNASASVDGDEDAGVDADSNYRFRSPMGRRTTSDDIQEHWGRARRGFRRFDADLRDFFTSYWPQNPIGDSPIKVSDYTACTLPRS